MEILPKGSGIKEWIVSTFDGSGDTHVHPEDDLKKHVLDRNCWCRPIVDSGYLIVHNSLDRREDYEDKIH